MCSLSGNLGVALRRLARRPCFTAAVVVTLALVALFSTFLPALRAVTVNPVVALREE